MGRLRAQIIDKSTNGDFELSGNRGGSPSHASLHVPLRKEGLEQRLLGLEHRGGELALEQVRVLRHEPLHGVGDRTRIVFYPATRLKTAGLADNGPRSFRLLVE